MDPIDQQRRRAQLAYQAPTGAHRISRPEEGKGENPQKNAELDQYQSRAVEPEIGLRVERVGYFREIATAYNQTRAQQRAPLHGAIHLIVAQQPDNAAGAQPEREERSPWEEAEEQVVRRNVIFEQR